MDGQLSITPTNIMIAGITFMNRGDISLVAHTRLPILAPIPDTQRRDMRIMAHTHKVTRRKCHRSREWQVPELPVRLR